MQWSPPVKSTFWTRAWSARLVASTLALLLLTMDASAQEQAPDRFQLAVLEADNATPLEDIVSGRARQGFTPLVGNGLSLTGKPGRTIWLRLRTQLPADGGVRYVSLPRQAMGLVRLYTGGPPIAKVDETGIGRDGDRTRWPDSFVLRLPNGASGATTLYLQLQGHGYLNLQPRIISDEQVESEAKTSSRAYGFLYTGLFLVAILAMFRRWSTGERTFRVAEAAFVCLAASIVGNYHLQLTLGSTELAGIPGLPPALWVLACAPLLWATQQYAGNEKNIPDVAHALDRVGFVFLLIGAAFLFVPVQYIPQLQLACLGLLAFTALICVSSLFFDPRHWRWSPILIWIGLLPALFAIPLSMMQLIPASIVVRRGFQFLIALQLAVYLLLPWIRKALQERAKIKRSVVVEASAEEKIAHAREHMISSLQAGMESAVESDMEWIAYRRLLGGLKPVLPQTAAAVIAMNYHNEDLLLVEPKSAEPRFQMLLAQRGSLLKNLSRSLAPQQIGIDFDGPEGPLPHVLLAIIPLPIDRPGWGALVIERNIDVTYSDEELDLCTEFAALATTAADEAAEVMQMRQVKEIDAESGVYRGEMAENLLRSAQDLAVKKRKPMGVLRVLLDNVGGLDAQVLAPLLHLGADLIRDEIDYGETICRVAPDQFMVLLSGRSIGEARALGERICGAVRKLAVPTTPGATLTMSIGVSQMQPGERTPHMMLERSNKALDKSRQYGGNQVQAIASTTV
jgi:GGDEF domain-containing protein